MFYSPCHERPLSSWEMTKFSGHLNTESENCWVYPGSDLATIPIWSMGKCKKDVTPLLTHWSNVFLALYHRCVWPQVWHAQVIGFWLTTPSNITFKNAILHIEAWTMADNLLTTFSISFSWHKICATGESLKVPCFGGSKWQQVKANSANGLVPSDNKPLPEPLLTQN